VKSRVVERFSSGRALIYKLQNGQYWLESLPGTETPPPIGRECLVVPGTYLYSLYIGDSNDPLGVMQIPVVLDTSVLGDFEEMLAGGVYALDGAGYWKVFLGSASPNPRVILASPNNLNYWIFTAGNSDDPVDPVVVRADSTVTSIEATGFQLANGQAWAYFGSNRLQPPVVRDHVIVYDLTLYDDAEPDPQPLLQNAWVDGRSMQTLMLVELVR
jgi:hypothetical protein